MTGGLISVAHGARSVRVGVVGDLILDRYLQGEAERISPEAPIPVLVVRKEEVRLGGAGNVVANLLALDSSVWAGGVIGDDENGRALAEALRSAGADVSAVVTDGARPTIEKVRLIARSQQILRFDREDVTSLAGDVEQRLVASARALAAESDVVVVSDYAKGVVTPAVFRALVESGTRVVVDPKGSDYTRYAGAYAITPNKVEAEAATRVKIDGDTTLEQAAAILHEVVGAEVVIITLGADGIYCSRRGGAAFHVRSEARKVYDVTGAGDTVIALLARFLGADVPLEDAVRIANVGAGIVVGKLGAAAVTLAELYRGLKAEPDDASRKILTRAEAGALVRDLRARGMSIVFTNGCFDVLHAGHARYLAQAKAEGDVLVVGLNDDASITRQKGPERPLVALEDRSVLLAALEDVDFVVPFGEDTPADLIREITPDVLVKGADWKDKGVVGREWVEQHGGRVVLAPLLAGRSTTGLVERIRGGASES